MHLNLDVFDFILELNSSTSFEIINKIITLTDMSTVFLRLYLKQTLTRNTFKIIIITYNKNKVFNVTYTALKCVCFNVINFFLKCFSQFFLPLYIYFSDERAYFEICFNLH